MTGEEEKMEMRNVAEFGALLPPSGDRQQFS